MKKFLVVLSAVAAVGVGVPQKITSAYAEEAAQTTAPRMTATADNVEQKSRFVTNLLTKSASSRAVGDSSDQDAKALMVTASGLVEEANKLIADGNFVDADVKLNKAVSMIMGQTRKVSLGATQDTRSKQIYENRLGEVKALIDAYERVSKEKDAPDRDDRRSAMTAQMDEVAKLVAANNYEAAVAGLNKAYTTISGDVAALRDGDKLRKDLSFASPEEEFIYEIDRNDSHQFLVKMTLSEKPPHEMYLAQITTIRGEAEALRKKAEAEGKSQNFAAGIKVLGESTQLLIKALRMAGAYIPG